MIFKNLHKQVGAEKPNLWITRLVCWLPVVREMFHRLHRGIRRRRKRKKERKKERQTAYDLDTGLYASADLMRIRRNVVPVMFHPSSRTVVLGSTQPLTEMSTRNLPGGVKGAGA
jgi:hypothetical protein